MKDLKDDNKILKEVNNKLKGDNKNLKNEIELLKNNNNQQITNLSNMLNQLKQQLNEINNKQIEQSSSLLNQQNLNNANKKLMIFFRTGSGLNILDSCTIIACQPYDYVFQLINKFKEYYKYKKMILNLYLIPNKFMKA